MSTLAELPELVGFFSYSREDDEDSRGALSALRERIQRELRGQLGRSMKTLRLWQDKEAIAAGTLWESEIKTAIEQSVSFIPIITPTAVRSPYCKFELDSFLAREAALDRSDLVFPILYVRVPGLDDDARRRNDPVLTIIAKRQYLDWRELRHRDINSADIMKVIERFCAQIADALDRPWVTPEERQRRKAEAEELVSRAFKYESGTGDLPKDEKEAARLYKLAADKGNAWAQAKLGVWYQNGCCGLSKDDNEAVRLYKLAADSGNASAQANLGVMYEYGRGGLPKDEQEAVSLQRLAADQGDASAQCILGFMYANGRGGLAKDDTEAVRLYRLAADQGNATAQSNLGFMYESGRGGLAKDETEAVRLYKLAADQGNEPAKQVLARRGGGNSGS